MRRFCLKSMAVRAFSLVGLLPGIWTMSTTAALADESGWALTQRSDKLGDQYVYVAPSGVKLVNPKLGYSIILCAPDWNVCLFSDKSKTFYSAPYDGWMNELATALGDRGTALRAGHWYKSKEQGSSIAGLRATSYVMQGAASFKLRNATCWVSNDIIVPEQITELLAKSYGLPLNKAYPLKLNTVDTSGKLSVQLDTFNSRVCRIPASYFYLPSGYKRVDSKEEVMIDDDTKAILRDLANDGPDASSSQSATQASRPQQTYQQQTYQQQTYQQQTQSQYAQQPQAQQPTQQQGQTAATPGVITLPNGQTIDREKLKKIIEAIKNSGKTPDTK